jgi:hypothetical protein
MERVRVLDPRPDAAAVKQTYDRAVELLPALREASIANAWAGFVDSTPDGVPGIGEVPEVPGFILAAGFSGHGFGIGPGAGHLIADLDTGAEPILAPAPSRPARFSESAWGKVADFNSGRLKSSQPRVSRSARLRCPRPLGLGLICDGRRYSANRRLPATASGICRRAEQRSVNGDSRQRRGVDDAPWVAGSRARHGR